MSKQRTILHLDLDAFFCAVEEQHNPDLIGKAFAVGASADQRGVVASCSYPARQFGVRSAMPMAQAVRLCPELIIVSRKMGDYSARSQDVMDILHDLTPLVEQLSIDEAFMNVTGIGSGETVAKQLQTRIDDELGLPCSLGVATNKLVAKIANNIGKSQSTSSDYPRAITHVSPGDERAFLAPLDIRELWGVGPKTAQTLRRMGIHTIGDIAAADERDLARQFGKLGHDLAQRAQGIDNRPIETDRDPKSISRETTFSEDVTDSDTLKRTLRKLADSVGYRLRKKNLSGTTVKIKLRWADFTTLTRQTTLTHPIDQDNDIYRIALDLFTSNYPTGQPVRLIGVGVAGLESGVRQLSLWDQPKQADNRQLQTALDEIRQKFGDSAIQRGTHLSTNSDTD